MVQLGRPSPTTPEAPDLARALAASAAGRGHRPAVTVLGAGPGRDRRDEQAFASLAQWTSKGAHLLELDAMLEPGDLVHLDAPAGWLPAAVCLAAWWVGAAVTDDPARATVSIRHEAADDAAAADWVLGDDVDGSPVGTPGPEPWAVAVQAFPDQPPPTRAGPESPAVVMGDRTWTQADLLREARGLPPGRLGVRTALSLFEQALLLAARPATVGDPTVLVVEATQTAIEAEKIADWR